MRYKFSITMTFEITSQYKKDLKEERLEMQQLKSIRRVKTAKHTIF